MRIVATGMHDGLAGVAEPRRDLGTLIGQASGFLDGQGIHVGPVHDHRPWPVAQDTHHAGSTDCTLHFETLLLQGLGHLGCSFLLLKGQLRVTVQLLELRNHLRFVLFNQAVDLAFQIGRGGMCCKSAEAGKGKQALMLTQSHGVIPCTGACTTGPGPLRQIVVVLVRRVACASQSVYLCPVRPMQK
ncbi:hypothetical protein D3C77_484430 [compost metagenome]